MTNAMFRNYHIHKLDGYTDGRESWLKYAWARSKDEAERIVADILKQHPGWKLRIRLAPKRR
jgi:hypothetical protein